MRVKFPNACCNDDANLVETQLRDDLVVSVCQKCHRRHFELSVDPIRVNITGRAA